MNRPLRFVIPLVSLAVLAGFTPPRPSGDEAGVAVPNDNRRAAGRLSHGVLALSLEARTATWYPEGPNAPGVPVHTFAERGRAAEVPGPLIRVTSGTTVRVTLHNRLDKRMIVRGLQDHGAPALDTIDIAAGATRIVTFVANTPGTFYYIGRTKDAREMLDWADDSQLVGALIVDAPGRAIDDRVMVITLWEDSLRRRGRATEERETMTINGLSWPHTERLHHVVGDSVHWRVINVSTAPHPMHLHGFYFRVDSRGDAVRDTAYTESQRRQAVTEFMSSGTTMTMSWVPTRPGNWLFHCHLIFHIDATLRLADRDTTHGSAHGNHALEGMSGLVMGIDVAPRREAKAYAEPTPARRMRLFVNERARVYGAEPGFSFVMQEGASEPARDSIRLPSSTIVLRRGEPTEITVINHSRSMASIHWHGIELESFYDGVGGWSGWGSRIAPIIAPGDSFAVRMTPDRAGTFIYHTHSDEAVQLTSGLYGALLVLPPDTAPDPDDRLFLLGEGGPARDAVPFVNGSATPAPVVLSAGTRHRIRLINISAGARKRVRILADSGQPVSWRAVAKDGADLPLSQRTERVADLRLGPGETADFELASGKPATLRMEIVTSRKSPIPVHTHRISMQVR